VLEDFFAAGNTLDLRGRFAGDVWGGGGTAIAAGTFTDNVRLASRLVQVSGRIGGSLTAAGTTVKIEPSAVIGKSMLCFGENVISEGSVAGSVRIAAQQVTLGGNLAGDVSIAAQEIVILPGTVIGGDLSYTAPKELLLSPSVTLGGKLTRTFEATPPRRILKPDLVTHFVFAIAALVTGMAFGSLFPRYTAGTAHALHASFGPCLLIGFGALFLIPTGAFLILFTVVGLPLSLLLILFYLILLYLSKIVVGLWLGGLLLRRKELSKSNLAGTLAAGLLVIYALTAFTAASMIAGVMIAILGLGALLLALFKKPVMITDIKQTTTEG
jgi:cytoskeletal protein CcmA (bactofilin family)